MLHITNGDCTVEMMRRADLPGEIVAWEDVLHEGPVPDGRSLDELRSVRARFLAGQGWAPYAAVLADFARRDAALAGASEHDEVVLWFEHDLYDQLQLLQLLDWFAGRDLAGTRLSLICVGAFPGVEPFHGLGQLTPLQLASLFPVRGPVTQAQLALGRVAWAAFRSPDPTALETILAGDTTALPFLRAALERHLEQFPSTRDGLSRTERQVLEAVAAGADTPVAVFRADQAREPAPYMGDSTLWTHLRDLTLGSAPVLALSAPALSPTEEGFGRQSVALVDRGRAVLAGRADRIGPDGIDRWLGGVHLRGADAPWRWDGRRLVASTK